MLLALLAALATAPDGTNTATRVPLFPMCWRVDAAPRTTFSVYVRGHARLFAADHHGWWVTGWDEGRSHGSGAWERVAVRIDSLFGVVCVTGTDGAVMWGAMMMQDARWQTSRTNELLHSNDPSMAWDRPSSFRVTCASSDPGACR